jgi:hypothetical protein
VKIQFDIDERVIRGIEATMGKAGICTKRELFNLALSLLEWAADARMRGRVIASVDPETERYHQVVLPALENLWKISSDECATKARTARAASAGLS